MAGDVKSSSIPSEELQAATSSYISPGIKVGEDFSRKETPAYLKCSAATERPERGFGNFSFKIIASKGTPFSGEEVGVIAVRYSQKASPVCSLDRAVEIGLLEIEEPYRRNHFGEAALRTILGIFRSPKRSSLIFDRFCLTVGLGSDREAARSLYKKIGFEIEAIFQPYPEIGYQDMTLNR